MEYCNDASYFESKIEEVQYIFYVKINVEINSNNEPGKTPGVCF
jgi:hypothetical protein